MNSTCKCILLRIYSATIATILELCNNKTCLTQYEFYLTYGSLRIVYMRVCNVCTHVSVCESVCASVSEVGS